MTPEGEIHDAIVALEAGRLSVAMQALSRAWAQARDPRVAEALERLGVAFSEGRAPIAPSHRAWMEREAEGLPGDTALLIDQLNRGQPGQERLKERVQLLCQRLPDPRAFASVLSRVRRLPWAGHGVRYQKLLDHHVDPRASLEIPPEVEGPRSAWTERLKRVAKLADALDTRFVAGGERLRESVQHTVDGPRERWMEREDAATDPVLQAMWAAVLDGEPEARLVSADRVAETHPDWGTFIHLSIEAQQGLLSKPKAKVFKALSKQLQTFLGPLANSVNKSGLAMRGGFLDAANTITGSEDEARVLGDRPEWGTARALWAHHTRFYEGAGVATLWSAGSVMLPGRDGDWFRNPAGKPLIAPQVKKLAKGGPWPWEVLQVRATASFAGSLIRSLPQLNAPHLHTLVLVGSEVDPAIAAARSGIRTLVFSSECRDVAGLARLPALEALQVDQVRLRLEDGQWRVRFAAGMAEAMDASGVLASEIRRLLDSFASFSAVYDGPRS